MTTDKVMAIIVAGGRGSRTGLSRPKQYADVGGVPMLRRTLSAFLSHPGVSGVLTVIGEDAREDFHRATAGLSGLLPPVTGGASRQASVFNGLKALEAHGPSHVLIHDGARPFVSAQTISGVISALQQAEGAIAALPVADTLKRANAALGIDATVSREGLWRAQTPQGFRFTTILRAHRDNGSGMATDDAALLEGSNIHVALVPDDPTNIKLTYKEDFALAELLLAGSCETRTGLGVDVHAFEPGDAVILGGVSIPHSQKLKGHSDADVVLHAIADAIYGALAEGDIGVHFPPSDEKWRGAASSVFIEHARERLAARNAQLNHVDVTIMCEAPKVSPHRDMIRQSIAGMLHVDASRVAVKATTTEQLGFTGRREGIAAQAVATISVPAS